MFCLLSTHELRIYINNIYYKKKKHLQGYYAKTMFNCLVI